MYIVHILLLTCFDYEQNITRPVRVLLALSDNYHVDFLAQWPQMSKDIVKNRAQKRPMCQIRSRNVFGTLNVCRKSLS